ncbi:hypothetical protein CDL15_Pgr026716 [Punica granatum]|nr:hypothetical protein CDL15_Pgr026716 [Punica granatum]
MSSASLLSCSCGKPEKAPSQALHRKGLKRAPGDTTALSMDDEDDEDEDEEDYRFSLPTRPNNPPTMSPYFPEFGMDQPRVTTRVVSPCRKITNSVAFVKDSEDPYRDFRRSMLQMIFDREIKSREDLQELLNCFLQLNSPSHHDAIIQAFTEIWNSVFSDKNKAVAPHD